MHLIFSQSPFSRQWSICSAMPWASASSSSSRRSPLRAMLLAGRAEPGMSHVAAALGRRRERQRRPAAFAAQIVGQLVGRDREQIALQRPPRVVVRQAGEKADERFLHDVFAGRPPPQPALDERQQPAFVLGNQRIPGLRLAGADLLHQQHVGMRRVGHGWKHGAGSRTDARRVR